MRLEGCKVLVTGAGGFIGSHTVEHLVEQGARVSAFVRYVSDGRAGWLDALDEDVRESLEIVRGDIRDRDSVMDAARGCQAVLHLAALIGIPYSYLAPRSYVEVNVTGTLNVLAAARALDLERVVVTSTSEVYGTAKTVPITEDHPLDAQSPYAATKVGADQLALSWHRAFETPVVVLRPFNTYGPRQSLRAVIPSIITQIAAGTRRLSLGSLAPTRDFTEVADTARGLTAALTSDGAIGRTVQLGTGLEISIGDLVEEIAGLMETEVEVTTDPARLRPEASEVQRLIADPSRASELLGWAPQRTGRDGLREGLQRTITWFREPRNLARYRPEDYGV